MSLPPRFAVSNSNSNSNSNDHHVFSASHRRELGDDWLSPSARTYRIHFQHTLTSDQVPSSTQASTFSPVSLVIVRGYGQYHGCGQYHGEIVHNTAWRSVGVIGDLPLLEFTPQPPWPGTN